MAENRATEINGEEEEDEALRIAIAMSLGQDPNSGTIDLTQDDEPASFPAPKPVAMETPTSSLSVLGLDRKKMEEERLARASKRKASELSSTPSESARPQQRQKTTKNVPRTLSILATPPKLPGSTRSATSTPPQAQFPQGVVKKTWVKGQPRLGDDITLEEVLQKDILELAVLSSFQWADDDWLLSKINLNRTKILCVAFAANEAHVCGLTVLSSGNSKWMALLTSIYRIERRDALERPTELHPVLFPAHVSTGINALEIAASQVFQVSPHSYPNRQSGPIRLGRDRSYGECKEGLLTSRWENYR